MFYSEYREGKNPLGKAPLSILSQESVYYILELMVDLQRVHPLQDQSPRSPLLGKSSSSPFQLRSMASSKFLQLGRVSKGLLNLSHTAVQCFGSVSTTPPLSFLSSAKSGDYQRWSFWGEKGDSSPPHPRRSGFPIRAGRRHPSGGQLAQGTAAAPGRGAGSLPGPGAPHRSNSQSDRLPHCPVTRPPD